jgi:predicted dienelactone hydrolase
MNRSLMSLPLLGAVLLMAQSAWSFQAGWRQMEVPGAAAAGGATTVALYYPTQAPARPIPMGPFTPNIAIGAPPQATVKGLIVLSHGTGGSELGHGTLAQALAEAGYLVAALRHPRDNWQDRSLLDESAETYFAERPRQASRVIDALLADPQWAGRIARDARGPRVGALGHSAGGYTVLALAGAQPDPARVRAHCDANRAADPIFCRTGRASEASAATAAAPSLADPRVRAVAALAPVGVVFTAESLSRIRLPVLVVEAENDRWLVPRFHSEWIARNLPGAELRRVPNAWHFAFMDTPGMAIPTEDGDARADPAGFDRAAFLARLSRELVVFFDKAFE